MVTPTHIEKNVRVEISKAQGGDLLEYPLAASKPVNSIISLEWFPKITVASVSIQLKSAVSEHKEAASCVKHIIHPAADSCV